MIEALWNNLKLLRRMQWLITAVVLLLLTIGVFFIYSACFVSPDQPVRPLYQRQIVWALVGLACYAGFALADYRALRQGSWWFYAVTLALLVLVLFTDPVLGARRRLLVFGVGLQASEFAKVATIVLLARKLSRPGIDLGHLRPLLLALVIVLVPTLLILVEPDLGTAMILIPIAFLMVFVAGVPLRPLLVLVAVGALAAGTVLSAALLPRRLGADEATQQRVLRWVGLSEYQRDRILVYVERDIDPLGVGWNKRQSQIAVGSGGVWGKGFCQGTQNVLGFLPRKVAPTDFIFAVIAEEKGFVGCLTVIGLFCLLLGCCIHVALVTTSKMGRLLCVGIAAMIFSHVFVNIAMTMGLLPITGLPLPLLSYGGSFMLAILSGLGMVQSVYIRSRHADSFEQGALGLVR